MNPKFLPAIAVALLAGLIGGFVGGAASTRTIKTRVVKAEQFVVVDQRGIPRAALTILPDRSDKPNCGICDGQPHFITTDRRGRLVILPPSGPQPLSPAELTTLLKLLMMLAK